MRLVVKHNPYRYRDFSRIASEAALAAGDQGKFWEMHHLLLKNSPDLDRGNLLRYAKEIGLDVNRIAESIDGGKHGKTIVQDQELAVSLDLYSTPTFFINGRKIVGDRPYEYLKKIIDEELAAAK